MAKWITDRTQADVDRVKELTAKARTGTWTTAEQQEWASGMKGALSYTDYARIEQGMKELADIVGVKLPIDPISVVTALNTSGNIPAWDTYPSKSEFFMPLTAKKAGLPLRSLGFRVKGYMPGKMRTVLRKYGTETALVDKSIDLVKGYNDVVLDMGSIVLEKGVEYQLYFAAANNFYPLCRAILGRSKRLHRHCTRQRLLCDDAKMIFSGTIHFHRNVYPRMGAEQLSYHRGRQSLDSQRESHPFKMQRNKLYSGCTGISFYEIWCDKSGRKDTF